MRLVRLFERRPLTRRISFLLRRRPHADYSKWDDIDTDSDDDAPQRKQKAAATSTPAAAGAAAPMDKAGTTTEAKSPTASGSSWNVNSWHFEETKLDEWGKERLTALLHRASVHSHIEHLGVEVELEAYLVVKEITGECWVHIRKGKKVCGYNFDIKVDWAGKILGGSGLQVHGFVEHSFTVDDDDDEIVFRMAQDVPFKQQIGRAVKATVAEKCDAFVKELEKKGPSGGGGAGEGLKAGANVQVGQYKKYTEGPDGVAALQERARQISLQENEAGKEGKRNHQKRLHTLAPTL